MKTSCFLDFRRSFRRRWSVGGLCRLSDFVGQPVFVAVIVALAFLAKDEKSLLAFNHAFFYFSGLYAFWVGMFGSCQSLDGEVQNGEWSYWTLGLRRNIPRHVWSVFGVNSVFAVWNVFLFLATIVMVAGVLSRNGTFNPFIAMFLTTDSIKADPFWQAGGLLWPLLVAKFGSWAPLLFSVSLFAVSLFSAALCGVCFGMLFSAVFRDPAVSLNGTVGFVVLLGMLSLLGLQGDKSRSNNAPNLSREFLPRIEAGHLDSDDGEGRTGALRLLVDASRFLPQRYFFNVARMPMQFHVAREVLEDMERELDRRTGGDGSTGWWNKSDSMSWPNNSRLSSWGLGTMPEEIPDDLDVIGFLSDRIGETIREDERERDREGTPGFLDRNRFDLYARTLVTSVGLELLPVFLQCIACLLAVHVCILVLPAYRQLR